MRIIQKFGESYEQTQIITETTRFNSNFTKFEGRNDITAQEIVTICNFIKEYNNENDPDVDFKGISVGSDSQEFIKENTDKKFECKAGDIEYDSTTGRISSIMFRQI